MRTDPIEAAAAYLREQGVVEPIHFTDDIGDAACIVANVLQGFEQAGWRLCGLVDEVHYEIDEIWTEQPRRRVPRWRGGGRD